jgi:hypothetical protein
MLNGIVNPGGSETKYHFDYVSDGDYKTTGFSGPNVLHGPEANLPADWSLHAIAYEASGLVPSTVYHFRLVVSNSDGSQAAEGEFETLPPLALGAAWATEVGTESVILHGEANPLGISATGYLEYVEDSVFQESGFAQAQKAPNIGSGESPLDFGAGEAPTARSTTLFGLRSGTTYHYRLVVEDQFTSLIGPEHTFTTVHARQLPGTACANEEFRTAFSAALPDCRAYEMVTPLDKNNGDSIPLGQLTTSGPAALDLSSDDGTGFTYSVNRTFGDAVAAPYNAQYLAGRTADGWSNHGISAPRTLYTTTLGPYFQSEFRAFSPDLCDGWFASVADPALTPAAVPNYPNIYRRGNCGSEEYEAVTTVKPPHVPFEEYFDFEVQGISADGRQVAYVAPDNLAPEAPSNSNGHSQLYFSSEGATRFVCFTPDGKASKQPCSAGVANTTPGSNLYAGNDRALSSDGRRLYWTLYSNLPNLEQGELFLRVNPGEGQSKLKSGNCAEAEKACTMPVSDLVSSEPAHFWGAAADGSRALFTVMSGPLKENLYVYDAADRTTQLIAEKVPKVMGTSEDAARVYFASQKALAGGAVDGNLNLYMYDATSVPTVTFIGALAPEDSGGQGELAALSKSPYARLARISPDGLHAAFVSKGSPTGYDNLDAKSGKPDSEVYLYDASTEALACVSCNPSGARPLGGDLEPRGRTYLGAARFPGSLSNLDPSRPLSKDGSRLFFESVEALVPNDTNGQKDVYEWEAPGSGDCDESANKFSAPNAGCLSLISSGQSPLEAEFLDASPTGNDVFFATASSLLPQDYGLVDIYDARQGGGYPAPPVDPATCEGEACQGPYVPPHDPTPASSTYEGPGNTGEAPAKAKHKGRRQHKKHHKRRNGSKDRHGRSAKADHPKHRRTEG